MATFCFQALISDSLKLEFIGGILFSLNTKNIASLILDVNVPRQLLCLDKAIKRGSIVNNKLNVKLLKFYKIVKIYVLSNVLFIICNPLGLFEFFQKIFVLFRHVLFSSITQFFIR